MRPRPEWPTLEGCVRASPKNESEALSPLCLYGIVARTCKTAGRQLKTSARSSTDRASDYGSEGWGFESLRARPGQRPLPVMEGAFLLTPLLTVALSGVRDRASEDIRGFGELVADHVCVHAQRDGGVGVA